MRIVRVRGAGFGALKSFDVDLSCRGLVLVLGENRDSEAASSNGSGKSTLLRLVPWALFGVDPAGGRVDAMVNQTTGELAVTVDLVDRAADDDSDGNAEVFSVSRGRVSGRPWCKVTSGVDADGKEIVLAEGADAVEHWATRAMGAGYDAFVATSLYTAGGASFLRAGDADRKALFRRLLPALDRLDQLSAAAASRKAEMRSKGNDARLRVQSTLQDAARRDKESEDALVRSREWLAAQARTISSLETTTNTPVPADAARDPRLAELEAADVDGEFTKAGELLRLAEQAATLAASAEQRAASEAAATRAEVAKLEAANKAKDCVTCGQPMPQKAVADLSWALVKGRGVLHDQDKVAQSRKEGRAAADGEVRTARVRASAASAILRELSSLRQADAGRASARATHEEKARAARKRIEEERAVKDPHAETIALRKGEADAARVRAVKLGKLVDLCDRESGIAAFWERGFGREGLQSLMLDGALAELQRDANGYLETLSDGDLALTISATSETKAGHARERIDVALRVEGVDGVPPSRGQETKVSVALTLALMDVASRRAGVTPGLLMVDEALDGLDGAGRQRVVDLLRSLRGKRETILVVSHDDAIPEAFESVITVVKEHGVAHVVDGASA